MHVRFSINIDLDCPLYKLVAQFHMSISLVDGMMKIQFTLCPLSVITYNTIVVSLVLGEHVCSILLLHAIFLWNTSPTGATSNGNLSNLYLPNWHANVVRYDNLSSGFRLWYPRTCVSKRKIFCIIQFWKISLCASPLDWS